MSKKSFPIVTVKLDRIVSGGQTITTLESGQKLFVWGGLPGETVEVQITKKKSKLVEGYVTKIINHSPERTLPRDPDSFLSTSPWQIMSFDTEQKYKIDLIYEAFRLHHISLPNNLEVYSDGNEYDYRNKVEFSWYFNKQTNTLDLAFFKRSSHSKISVEGSSIAKPEINDSAIRMRNILRERHSNGFDLKTLLVRTDRNKHVCMQLYVKNRLFKPLSESELAKLNIDGFEMIFSNPKSPASVITKRLQSHGQNSLSDDILAKKFSYSVEGFFQINLPVYETALKDIKEKLELDKPTIDLYSGVGTIGLTVSTNDLTLVESNQQAFDEMEKNILAQNQGSRAKAILSLTEKVVEHITQDSNIIVDPPRAGLHDDVIGQILNEKPEQIIYLSCNPTTQARDVAKLLSTYKITFIRGYNFFPRTPHIENLVVLKKN